MDEVGWEAVLLLQRVGLPGGERGTQSGLSLATDNPIPLAMTTGSQSVSCLRIEKQKLSFFLSCCSEMTEARNALEG